MSETGKAIDQLQPLAFNHRKRRAATLALELLDRMNLPKEVRYAVDLKLRDALQDLGAEVITDEVRAAAGLPPRNEHGSTVVELMVIESMRLRALLGPPPPFIMPDVDPRWCDFVAMVARMIPDGESEALDRLIAEAREITGEGA